MRFTALAFLKYCMRVCPCARLDAYLDVGGWKDVSIAEDHLITAMQMRGSSCSKFR
jgi:hypothetical protein